jgi:putative addiction module component (TIGR02574 family)
METEFPAVFELDDDRKLELIEALWESIASSGRPIKVSDELKQMLDRELEEFPNNRRLGRPWREVMDELDQRYA